MSARSGSGSIETTGPRSVTWRPQLSPSNTVSEICGRSRRWPRRARLTSMLSSRRPSTQSYQVAAECGVPSLRTVATTAGFGRRTTSSSRAYGAVGSSRRSVLLEFGVGVEREEARERLVSEGCSRSPPQRVTSEAPEEQDGRAPRSAERVEDQVGRRVVHADLKVRRSGRVERG